MLRQGLFDHHRLDSILFTASGSPAAAQGVIGPVPEGYAWYIESLAFAVIGNSHTAIMDAAITPDGGTLPAQATWDHQGLVWRPYAGSGAIISASESFPLALYMAAGHFLHFTTNPGGGTLASGDVVSATAQIAVHQLNPRYLMSPEDRELVRASHERLPEHPLAEVATAGRRAV